MSRRPPLWRVLEERPELSIHELIFAPLGWLSLFLVIHLPGRAAVFAQPLRRDWGTSVTNAAESLVHVARQRFTITKCYEWYFDKNTLDEILTDAGAGRVSWRHFTRRRFEELYGIRLPRISEVASVRDAERAFISRERNDSK